MSVSQGGVRPPPSPAPVHSRRGPRLLAPTCSALPWKHPPFWRSPHSGPCCPVEEARPPYSRRMPGLRLSESFPMRTHRLPDNPQKASFHLKEKSPTPGIVASGVRPVEGERGGEREPHPPQRARCPGSGVAGGGFGCVPTLWPSQKVSSSLRLILRDSTGPTAEAPLLGRKVIPRIKRRKKQQVTEQVWGLPTSCPPVGRFWREWRVSGGRGGRRDLIGPGRSLLQASSGNGVCGQGEGCGGSGGRGRPPTARASHRL